MKVTDAVMMRVRNAHADYVNKLERSKNIVSMKIH